jgi:hypothetical protein
VNTKARDVANNAKLLRVVVFGAVFMALLGSALHFFFDWFGQSTIVGLFGPINESIWEHSKLVFWPPLLWYAFIALSLRRTRNLELAVAAAAALWFMPLFQIVFYYAYAAIAHRNLFAMNILDFVLAIVLGQVLFYQLATRLHCTRNGRVAALLSVIVLSGMFVFFTLLPPHVPLFMDPTNGTYGLPIKSELSGLLRSLPGQ